MRPSRQRGERDGRARAGKEGGEAFGKVTEVSMLICGNKHSSCKLQSTFTGCYSLVIVHTGILFLVPDPGLSGDNMLLKRRIIL